jgi:hypothetical protein
VCSLADLDLGTFSWLIPVNLGESQGFLGMEGGSRVRAKVGGYGASGSEDGGGTTSPGVQCPLEAGGRKKWILSCKVRIP